MLIDLVELPEIGTTWVHRHGGFFRVLMWARNEETGEDTVIYTPLDPEKQAELSVRSAKSFRDNMKPFV